MNFYDSYIKKQNVHAEEFALPMKKATVFKDCASAVTKIWPSTNRMCSEVGQWLETEYLGFFT